MSESKANFGSLDPVLKGYPDTPRSQKIIGALGKSKDFFSVEPESREKIIDAIRQRAKQLGKNEVDELNTFVRFKAFTEELKSVPLAFIPMAVGVVLGLALGPEISKHVAEAIAPHVNGAMPELARAIVDFTHAPIVRTLADAITFGAVAVPTVLVSMAPVAAREYFENRRLK